MYYVYLTTNSKKNVLYTGITSDLMKRIVQHYDQRGDRRKFTGRYSCYNLLYYEKYECVYTAISREKEIKGWGRKKKIDLIRAVNPLLVFLNCELFDEWPPYYSQKVQK